MSAANARHSKGSRLFRGNGATPEVFSFIGDLTDVGSPTVSVGTIEATDLESTWKEFIVDIPDGGSVALKMNLSESNTAQAGIESDLFAGTLRNWRVVLNTPLSKRYDFAAYVTDFAATAATGALISAAATLKVSGAVTRV